MKVHFIALLLILCASGSAISQNALKDWTLWEPVQGDWAAFAVVVNFRGGTKSPEQLAKTNLKSLKVICLIGGHISGEIPPEARGVKTFKILYSQYGKFLTAEDFAEDWAQVYYSTNGQNVNPVRITRAATQFDVDEAKKPTSETVLTTKTPIILAPLGVEPEMTTKLTGRPYRIASEWRRKGDTIEIRLKDYRPS